MPCILKIRVISGRNLPVMDRTSELTDAYVEVRFADFEVQRTQICRKTLNPVWNEDFRFEVSDDAVLQNEPLELKVLDYDAITANDAVGSVVIDLNPLLAWDSSGLIGGWFPIYDTLRGVRGEVNAQIRLLFFGDVNPFKDSSVSVQFFNSTAIPLGYAISGELLGLVHAIENHEDPEYHWSDNFRTPRSSNEARQRLLFRLSGQIRRMLGRKVLEMGGNAVIGFTQYFDLESKERAITARAIGTAVFLVSLESEKLVLTGGGSGFVGTPVPYPYNKPSYGSPTEILAYGPLSANFAKKLAISPDEQRSESQSAIASENPENLSRHRAPSLGAPSTIHYKAHEQEIITLHSLPPGCLDAIGGLVTARSVKLLEDDNAQVREAWWSELREEIKSHARSLDCSHIMAYSETTSIDDGLCVLTAVGTAVNITTPILPPNGLPSVTSIPSEPPKSPESYHSGNNIDGFYDIPENGPTSPQSIPNQPCSRKSSMQAMKLKYSACRMCHIPFNRHRPPFPITLFKCGVCGKRNVPEILISTIEIPSELETIGQHSYLEAHVCRSKKHKEGETNATTVSDIIPFIEYDLHRQIMYKLKIQGMNALFGMKCRIIVGDSLIMAVASGTAVYCSALPTPTALQISRNMGVLDEEDKQLLELQSRIMQISEHNRRILDEAYLLKHQEAASSTPQVNAGNASESDSDNSVDMYTAADDWDRELYQKSLVVQIDDDTDEDLLAVLLDPQYPENFHLSSTGLVFGKYGLFEGEKDQKLDPYRMEMLTIVKQGWISLASKYPNRQLSNIFFAIYDELQFRLSYLSPCYIAGIDYDIQVLKDYEIQVRMTAVAIGIPVPDSIVGYHIPLYQSYSHISLCSMLSLPEIDRRLRQPQEESSDDSQAGEGIADNPLYPGDEEKFNGSINRRPSRIEEEEKEAMPHSTHIDMSPALYIDISPLSFIPGIETMHYLGKLSLHFVKETYNTHDNYSTNGLGGFCQVFLTEVQAIARAHVAAMGGNGIVAYRIDQSQFRDNLKNQNYGLISVSGDVVQVSYKEGFEPNWTADFAPQNRPLGSLSNPQSPPLYGRGMSSQSLTHLE